jgi:hypothetical protein
VAAAWRPFDPPRQRRPSSPPRSCRSAAATGTPE